MNKKTRTTWLVLVVALLLPLAVGGVLIWRNEQTRESSEPLGILPRVI
jgi:hypothetical protein